MNHTIISSFFLVYSGDVCVCMWVWKSNLRSIVVCESCRIQLMRRSDDVFGGGMNVEWRHFTLRRYRPKISWHFPHSCVCPWHVAGYSSKRKNDNNRLVWQWTCVDRCTVYTVYTSTILYKTSTTLKNVPFTISDSQWQWSLQLGQGGS